MALTRPVVSNKTAAADQIEEVEAVVEETMTAEGVTETVAAVEVEAAVVVEAVKAEEPKQEVAEVETPSAPANVGQQQRNAMAQFTQDQAALGFEGLEITGMSFDRIKLHEGQFLLGSDEAELGQEFDCIMHTTRNLYVVRQSTDNDAESFYSYDIKGATFTDGTSSFDKLQEWIEDGYGAEDTPLDIRPYIEATITLVNRDDEFDDQMAMLSIPPASKARLGGHAANAAMKFGGASLNQVITRCQVGKKIGEGQKAFRPWVFKVVKRVEA